MKTCTCCKKDRDLKEFTIDNSKPDGLYSICKICLKDKRDAVKARKRDYDKNYRLNNIEKLKNRNKIYFNSLPNSVRAAYNKKYRTKNKDKFNSWQLTYIKKNKEYFAYRALLNNYIKRFKISKSDNTINLLGYSVENFKKRIEFNFKEGMCWDNYGKWHIDHKKPISLFKKDVPASIVNALSNLQPLWAKDNLKKGNKFK